MTTIFDITGDNFFTPLASKNRKIYMNCILFLHDTINEFFEDETNDKNKIIEALTDHLNFSASIKIYDDYTDEELENVTDNASKARFIINTLENYGWLVEESIGDGKKAIDFSSHSYSFISLMNEMINNRKPSYTGFVRVIRDNANHFDYTSITSLEVLDKQLSDFVVSLRGLRSSIQRFYKNITKNKDSIDLETLLGEFTGEYKEAFFDSAYLRLKIIDNVDTEIPQITKKIEEVFNSFEGMERVIASRRDKDYPDYDSASKYVTDSEKRILGNLRTIPSLIKMIDTKNSKYITRTVSVIIHLINRGEDIEGILNRLITFVKSNDVDDNYISLFEMKHYSYDYLAKPRKLSVKPVSEQLPLDSGFPEDVKNKAIEMLKEDIKYNIKSVNMFVYDFLGKLNQRPISELEIKSKFELVMIVCIIMYSKVNEALYDIKYTDKRISKNGITFNDFIVRDKGGIYND